MYKTDAIFNTNELRLPLSVIVGITNTRKTFLLAYCYITNELNMYFMTVLRLQSYAQISQRALEPQLLLNRFVMLRMRMKLSSSVASRL